MNNILIITQTVWLEMLRRKDVYIILALQAFCTLMLTSINAFGSDVPSSYIMDIGLMLAFLLSIGLSIILGSRQFPAEIRSGTIFSMLTKPISRLEFLTGKWLGLWCGMLATNLLFYLIISGVTLSRNFIFEPTVLLQVFCLHAVLLGIIIAISLFFTMFFSQGSRRCSNRSFCHSLLPVSAAHTQPAGIRAWLARRSPLEHLPHCPPIWNFSICAHAYCITGEYWISEPS